MRLSKLEATTNLHKLSKLILCFVLFCTCLFCSLLHTITHTHFFTLLNASSMHRKYYIKISYAFKYSILMDQMKTGIVENENKKANKEIYVFSYKGKMFLVLTRNTCFIRNYLFSRIQVIFLSGSQENLSFWTLHRFDYTDVSCYRLAIKRSFEKRYGYFVSCSRYF